MHAVVNHVTINDEAAATAALESEVIPRIKQMPGFVGAYFVRLDGGKGVSVVAWASEEAARTAAEQVQPPGPAVTFDSVEVGEVAGSA
jgi:heme-degrading monooxygenase HmoA